MTISKNTRLRLALLTLLAAPNQSYAQGEEPRTSRWSAGLAVAVRDTVYAGESPRVQPFPLVTYEGKRFYVQGAAFGYRVIDRESFALNAFIAARLDGIDAKDFGRRALAERGIDRDLLEDRDLAADAGVSAVLRMQSAGEIEFSARHDATGASDGHQFSADYRYLFQRGSVTLIPGIGIDRLSAKLADHYYGTLPKEVVRGVVDYRPGGATIARASLTAIVPRGPRWVLIGSIRLDAYPDVITDSPLIDPDTRIVPGLFLGVTRSF